MGSGVWFKNIISKKKVKGEKSHKLMRHSVPENISDFKECHVMANGACVDSQGRIGLSIEDAAATRIQTAYRSYLVRKTFHQMKGMVRLRNLVKYDFVKKQASATLNHLHSWSRIQAQIRERRVYMVTEGRLRQKKAENQLKLDAKLHDLEVEWSGGCDTMDKALSRIHQRAEASIKRERAMVGGQTPIQVLGLKIRNLRRIGTGAGQNAGLLSVLGKAEFQQHVKVPKKQTVFRQLANHQGLQ